LNISSGSRPALSAAVLAGGLSKRMGTDKAFLEYRGRPFVSVIAEEMFKVSSEVLVVIGRKEESKFRSVLDKRAKVINDSYDFVNPMAGMLSAFPRVSKDYVAFVGCDAPLMKASVIEFLHRAAIGHSGAVPRWENGQIEPLCAVYNASQAEKAGLEALARREVGCSYLIALLKDVNYVQVEGLRRFDPNLAFLRNVNFREDYLALGHPGTLSQSFPFRGKNLNPS